MDNNKIQVAFAAIDKDYETYIPSFEERETIKSYVSYGKDNNIPDYLYGLYTDVSTLKTIINGTADYVCGDDVVCNIKGFETEVNTKGDTMRDLVYLCARDWLIYGGYAIQIIRNKVGEVRELYYMDFRYLRSSKKNEVFYYSEEYNRKYARSSKTIIYPKFIRENKNDSSSILYVTNEKSKTYPTPRYSGALKACEIEKNIDTYHLSSLENGFGGSYILNFLNGIPTDEQKAEIERNVNEKFCGSSNAGRVLINFANGKDNATTLDKLDVDDFGAKYESLAKRSREQIFVAFMAQPILFGLMKENSGFSQDEYLQAFALYNRTVVRAISQKITDSIDKIFGNKKSVSIVPFSLNNVEEENNTEKIIN